MKKLIWVVLIAMATLMASCTVSYAGWNGGWKQMELEPSGAIPVTLQDQTTPVFIIPMSQEVDSTELTSVTAIDDYTMTIADTTNFVDGSFVVCLSDTGGRYWYGYQVGAPVGSVITVDRPFDYAFQVGDGVTSAITNMNVNGATTTQIFRVRIGEPLGGIPVTIDVTRIIIVIHADSAVDLAKFGNLTALTKGITLRRIDGVYQNIFNVKSNSDFASLAFDLNMYAATNPTQGQDGLACRLTFGGQNKMGVVLRIGPNEDLQLLINDNLTGLVDFTIMVEGSLAIVD